MIDFSLLYFDFCISSSSTDDHPYWRDLFARHRIRHTAQISFESSLSWALFWTQRAESFLICRFHLSENDRKLIDNSMIFFWFFSLNCGWEESWGWGEIFHCSKNPIFSIQTRNRDDDNNDSTRWGGFCKFNNRSSTNRMIVHNLATYRYRHTWHKFFKPNISAYAYGECTHVKCTIWISAAKNRSECISYLYMCNKTMSNFEHFSSIV